MSAGKQSPPATSLVKHKYLECGKQFLPRLRLPRRQMSLHGTWYSLGHQFCAP
ncbi:similar to Casein kinase 1 epsilon [Ectocarpus siliculosus]|uniref:Similar to Casein kinase 1 epsilon n=1 Tax=Ectocarpus siliculosus TaxID=2880 RepID=D7G5X6_ECTSI|nr:similar to Casein kinase 1 epsilon [Ectocarpus siliculosus]|eukprot:CBJ27414.1 similar to Casein kinase 1 epsilon [Ectocarpus siliculosus]